MSHVGQNQVYKFVQFQVCTTETGEQICTLRMVKVVQICTCEVCTLLTERKVYKGVLCQFSVSKLLQIV